MKPAGPLPQFVESDDRGMLLIGGKRADELVAEAGSTPVFIYDGGAIRRQVGRFRAAMPHEIALHYAVKANPFAPLLDHMAGLVDGFDVASAGELGRVAHLGLPISFAGPGKTDAELETALRAGITIHVESEGEAKRALAIAGRASRPPRLAVRVNPPFLLKGAGMKMGGLASPFGVDHDRAAQLARDLIAAGADWRGFHIFAGSQALRAEAVADSLASSLALAAELAADVGKTPPEVNLGGGFGIAYFAGDVPLDIDRVGRAVSDLLNARPEAIGETRFSLELGRWLVGEAGVYLTRIVDIKTSHGKLFLVCDGGLNHQLAATGNLGAVLRRNYPLALAAAIGGRAEDRPATIVGPLCTPLDILGDDLALPPAQVGDLVAIFCAGAYGLSASPQEFLSHPRPLELLVEAQ